MTLMNIVAFYTYHKHNIYTVNICQQKHSSHCALGLI